MKPQILGELLVINNLTTAYALEIGHQLMNEQLFYGIAKTAEKKFKTDVQYFEGFSVEKISLSLVFQVWILPSKSNKSVKNTCILILKSLP